MLNFLIVIPVYNEDTVLGDLIKVLRDLGLFKFTLFVNDGSTDKTADILKAEGANYVSLEKNMGKGFAQRVGFAEALKRKVDAIITMDGDLQHPPSLVFEFLRKIEEGSDIVIGTRWRELNRMPKDRYLSNRLTTLAISLLCGRKVEDSQSGYRGYRREVIESLNFSSNKFEAESELLIKALLSGKKVSYVNIPANYHEKLRSKINRFIDTLRFLKMYFGLVWKKS
uniref:Glycosyltransferase family 2 protein n=1 Tax=candidate division WOR-3 bacterium TaxID=2052148 RepID=A0A7V3ZYE2_UNCW3